MTSQIHIISILLVVIISVLFPVVQGCVAKQAQASCKYTRVSLLYNMDNETPPPAWFTMVTKFIRKNLTTDNVTPPPLNCLVPLMEHLIIGTYL